MTETLSKASLQAYIHSTITMKNVEVVVVELNAFKDARSGKLQHRFEKLLQAHRKCFDEYEKLLPKESRVEVNKEIEAYLDSSWEQV